MKKKMQNKSLNIAAEQGVSIVMGARNEYPQVAMTICNLMEDCHASGIDKWEIILMDNGSEDETSRFFSWKPTVKTTTGQWKYQKSLRGLVNEGRLRIFFDPVLSNVGTRNKGVLHAKYPNIIFSDAHIIVRPGTIKQIVNSLDHFGGIVHSPIAWMGASAERPQAGFQYSYKVGEKIWGCVDEKTELLTSEGWKKHGEVDEDTSFATLNLKTKEIELQKSSNITRFDHDGNACRLKGRGYDLLLTPNHRCVVDNGNNLVIKEAKDLTRKDFLPLTNNGIKRTGKCDKDLVWLLSAIVCDGSLYRKRPGEKKEFIRLIAKKDRKTIKIEELLKNTKYSYYLRKNGCKSYTLFKSEGLKLLKFIPNKEFTYKFVNSLNREGLEELQKALLFFDGNRYKNDVTFTQARKRVSEMFEYISILLGNKIYTHKINPQIKKGNSFQKKILFKTYLTTKRRRIGVKKTDTHYKGKMWCPTVPNGTIFAKRNGKVIVTANTWNKCQVADSTFYIPFCGHAFIAVKKKEFLKMKGYPYAQRVYGGGEPHLDTKFWMMGSTSMMDPECLIYHLSAGRGYSWHSEDLLHNMFLVSYILGGRRWSDRILITYYNKPNTNKEVIKRLHDEALEEGEEEYQWLQKNKKYSFEDVLALGKESDCKKCTKRGRPDPHAMRLWDTWNEELHGTHRSWVQEFPLAREGGKIFIGRTEITDPEAIQIAELYLD